MAYDNTKVQYLFGTPDGSDVCWLYVTEDTIATVNTDGYFSDAKTLGMKKGHEVKIKVVTDATDPTTVSSIYRSYINAINADGSADIVDGTQLAATDTD